MIRKVNVKSPDRAPIEYFSESADVINIKMATNSDVERTARILEHEVGNCATLIGWSSINQHGHIACGCSQCKHERVALADINHVNQKSHRCYIAPLSICLAGK